MTVPRGFTLFLAGWAGFLTGCAPAPNRPSTADRRGVEATVNRYVEATNSGDAEALAQLYEDDAVLLPPITSRSRAAARLANSGARGRMRAWR